VLQLPHYKRLGEKTSYLHTRREVLQKEFTGSIFLPELKESKRHPRRQKPLTILVGIAVERAGNNRLRVTSWIADESWGPTPSKNVKLG
jgi:hypothetical protein